MNNNYRLTLDNAMRLISGEIYNQIPQLAVKRTIRDILGIEDKKLNDILNYMVDTEQLEKYVIGSRAFFMKLK